jgi:hypothetical protein
VKWESLGVTKQSRTLMGAFTLHDASLDALCMLQRKKSMGLDRSSNPRFEIA